MGIDLVTLADIRIQDALRKQMEDRRFMISADTLVKLKPVGRETEGGEIGKK